MADISVVVPVFQAAPYLPACLASLGAQQGVEAAFVLIDDGSTDGSGALLDAFAAKEPRALVRHTPNQGVSAARQLGVSLAQGDYVLFVDADDLLLPHALATLMTCARSTRADWVTADFLEESEGGRKKLVSPQGFKDREEGYCALIGLAEGAGNACNKLIRRELFQGVLFDETLKVGEDLLVNLQLVHRAETFAHLSQPTYVYRRHCQSAMAGAQRDYAQAHEPMLAAIDSWLLNQGLKEAYFAHLLATRIWIAQKAGGIRGALAQMPGHMFPAALQGVKAKRLRGIHAKWYYGIRLHLFRPFYLFRHVLCRLTGRPIRLMAGPQGPSHEEITPS